MWCLTIIFGLKYDYIMVQYNTIWKTTGVKKKKNVFSTLPFPEVAFGRRTKSYNIVSIIIVRTWYITHNVCPQYSKVVLMHLWVSVSTHVLHATMGENVHLISI